MGIGLRCGRQGETTTLTSLVRQLIFLSSEMDSRSVKNLSGRKIAPRSDVRVGATLQNTCDRNKTQIIGTWNVRTMLKTGKLENIKIEMKRLDIDILGLCEIRWPENGDFWSDDIRIIHTNSTKGQAGTGIALSKKWGTRVTNIVTYSSRICFVKIESTPSNLIVIQVYMPTTKADDEEVEEVYAGIDELLKHTKPHDNVIIMGDFNAIVGEGREGREVGDFGLGKRNARGERVVEFCKENGLIITNTRFQNPIRRIYTWKMPGDIARYQIDYILVKNRFKNQVKFCKAYPSADCDSDHNLVMMKCELRYKKPQRPKLKQDKYSVRLLKRAEVIEQYRHHMDLEYQKGNADDPVNKTWEKIKLAIKNAADNVLTKNEKEEPRKAWIDKEIIKLIDERRKYKNNKTEEGKQKYRQLRNQINREARKAKEEWLEQQCCEIDELFKVNKIDYAYRKIQQFSGKRKRNCINIRDKNGQFLVDDENIIERWREYIEELYDGEQLEEMITNEEETKLHILRSEFELALYDLKKNKAPGIDNITAELLQCASTKLKEALYHLTRDIYEKGEVPDDYCKSIIVTIPKKNGANSCEQFRTLSLLTHVSKILTKIINGRIKGKVEQYLKNDQYGFRRQKGTREAILGLRVLIEKQIDRNKVTYLAFIDLEKAFDNVNWNKMLLTLQEIGVEHHDLRIIHSLYKNQTACIKKGEITANAQIKKGVRQGCTLSPPLFNCYIEKVINTVKAKLTRLNIGIKIGGEMVQMIRFADDIVVIAESEGDIQRAVEEINEVLKTSEMKINSGKTKILVCARDPKIKADVYIDSQKLVQVDEMVYLGSKITSDGKSVREIKQRIALAKTAFSKKQKLLTSKKIHLNIKKRIIKTYVWSVATYGCETWVINDTEKKKLEAFEMWCWRRMEKISWIERKTNEEVLSIVREKRTLIDNIRARRWKMVGHALRHPEEMHNIILEGMIEGKKTAGRPRNSYIGQIKCDAKVKTFKELKEKASNRSEWRIGVVNQPSG